MGQEPILPALVLMAVADKDSRRLGQVALLLARGPDNRTEIYSSTRRSVSATEPDRRIARHKFRKPLWPGTCRRAPWRPREPGPPARRRRRRGRGRRLGAADTDWPRIAALYDRLRVVAPSPVVDLNR